MTLITRIGLLVILVGIFIPLVALPFTIGYNPVFGLLHSLPMMEVKTMKGSGVTTYYIPYKCLVSFGLILVFLGTATIVLSKKDKRENEVK
jgi:hypothetical protein